MKRALALLVFLVLPLLAPAQENPAGIYNRFVEHVSIEPSGSCVIPNAYRLRRSTGCFYQCISGTWTQIICPGSGSGTVTGVTADTGGTTTGAVPSVLGTASGIDTSRSADTVTIAFDPTEVSSPTWGDGTGAVTFGFNNTGSGYDGSLISRQPSGGSQSAIDLFSGSTDIGADDLALTVRDGGGDILKLDGDGGIYVKHIEPLSGSNMIFNADLYPATDLTRVIGRYNFRWAEFHAAHLNSEGALLELTSDLGIQVRGSDLGGTANSGKIRLYEARGNGDSYIELGTDDSLGVEDHWSLFPGGEVGQVLSVASGSGGDITASFGALIDSQIPNNLTLGDTTGTLNTKHFWATSYDRCTGYPTCSPSGTVVSKIISGVKSSSINNQTNHLHCTNYNYDIDGSIITSGEAAMKHCHEYSFIDSTDQRQYIEENIDVTPGGGSQWRPYGMYWDTGGGGSATNLNTILTTWKACPTCDTLQLNRKGHVNVGVASTQSFARLNVQYALTQPGESKYAVYSLMDLALDGTSASSYSFQPQYSEFRWSPGAANTIANATALYGLANITGSDTDNRTVAGGGAMIGVTGEAAVPATGSSTVTIPNLIGGKFRAHASGTATSIAITTMAAIVAESPGSLGAGVTVNTGAGIIVQNQNGHGSSQRAAILIEAQSGGSSPQYRGNLKFAGGDWNDGHIMLGNNASIWGTSSSIRFKADDAPTSSTDIDFEVMPGGARYRNVTTASQATLPADSGNVVTLTGSTAITAISTCDATNSGRPLIILCGGYTGTITDGNNIHMAGDTSLTCTTDDTISFVCDGTNWLETSRSVN